MTNEEILTDFMQKQYSDERLCWLLEHARSGKLAYYSCCCFIGIVTADHALCGEAANKAEFMRQDLKAHYADRARMLPGAIEAEQAYACLGASLEAGFRNADKQRRAKLIPLVEAEIARREALKQQENAPKDALAEVLA